MGLLYDSADSHYSEPYYRQKLSHTLFVLAPPCHVVSIAADKVLWLTDMKQSSNATITGFGEWRSALERYTGLSIAIERRMTLKSKPQRHKRRMESVGEQVGHFL